MTYFPNPIYERWLEAGNKEDFVNSLDEMEQEALFSGTVYQYYREQEYPPMEDYLDAIVKSDTVAQEEYITKCNSIKIKYPKPE